VCVCVCQRERERDSKSVCVACGSIDGHEVVWTFGIEVDF